MSHENRIVITGLGPLSAIGIGKEALWKSVLDGKTGLVLKDFFAHGKKVDSFYIHEINNFNINNFGIDETVLGDIENWKKEKDWPDLSYLLAATKLALDDSKLANNIGNNIGLVLTHENPGLDQFFMDMFNTLQENVGRGMNFKEFFEKFSKKSHDLQTFVFLYFVAKTFDIHGYSIFLNNACASGLYAIEAAADIIRSKKCNAVIVAAADRLSIFKGIWFKKLEMYPKDGKIKPFAKDRDGFVLGDGAAGMVLESLESALKRKARIYAEYLGGGFSTEGWKITIPDLTSDFYKTAIQQAIKNSNIAKEEIDLLVPHGVGTPITDTYEAKAITHVFGKNPKKPLISAFKPYIGHNLGSTALLETIILLLALEHNYIPPTLNCQNLDTRLNIQPVRSPISINLKIAMKIACGFAGYNGACIFKKVE